MTENLTISKDLAEFIVSARFKNLSARAVEQTRYALLDALGVSLAATTLGEGVDAFVSWAEEQGAKPTCKVFGHSFKTSASMAAFANGSLAHALDFEDAHDQALVHPNAAVIPAVLAVAQAAGKASGKDILLAIAVGCEVTCRLGFAVAAKLDAYSWYPPPILSAYGAAAAAAKILELSAEQIITAFSLLLSQATCSAEIKHNSQSHIRAVRDAFPAQQAVIATQLAKNGVVGFQHPLEGKDGFFAGFSKGQYDKAMLTNQLGDMFAIEDLSFKPWPSCRGTHTSIELVTGLCQAHDLKSDDIENIVVTSNSLNKMLAEPIADKRKPKSAIDAKFSIPFCIATAVVNGPVNLDSFSAESLSNPSVLSFANKVNYRINSDFSSPLMSKVEVRLSNGDTLTAEADNALGCPARPLSEDQLVEKFRHCLSFSKNSEHKSQAKKIADVILSIDTLDNLSKFYSLL